LPAGAARAVRSIQRKAVEDAALSAQTKVPALNRVSEKDEAARQQVGATEIGLVSTVQSPARGPRSPKASIASRTPRNATGRPQRPRAVQIIAAKEQAAQQQAGQPTGQAAEQEAQAAITRNGGG